MGDRLGERGTNGGLDERIAQKRDRKCWRSHLVASSLFRTSETMTTVGEQRRRLRGERRERFKHIQRGRLDAPAKVAAASHTVTEANARDRGERAAPLPTWRKR